MTYVAGTLLALIALANVGLVIFGLPGIWLLVLASAGLKLWMPEMIAWWQIGTLVGIAAVGEIVEFVASSAGATKAGGSRWGAIGALVGGIAGAIIGTPIVPVAGTILGGAIGAGLGAIGCELIIGEQTVGNSLRIGRGAAIGRLVATVAKTALSVIAAVCAIVFILI